MSSYKSAGNGLLVSPNGTLRGYRNNVTGEDVMGFGASVPILISSNMVINSRNVNIYDKQILEFSAAFTITIDAVAHFGFGFTVIPPASGNASIATTGGVLLNGAGTTITRAAAGNQTFSVIQRASNQDSYVVTGT